MLWEYDLKMWKVHVEMNGKGQVNNILLVNFKRQKGLTLLLYSPTKLNLPREVFICGPIRKPKKNTKMGWWKVNK